MRALVLLALVVLAPATAAQQYTGPTAQFPVPEGWRTVETGLGGAFAVDLLPVSEADPARPLPLARFIFVPEAESANALAQEFWNGESGKLGAGGWQVDEGSGPVERLIPSVREQDRTCGGQRIRLRHAQDAGRTATCLLFAWAEADGSFGAVLTYSEDAAEDAAVASILDGLRTDGLAENAVRTIDVDGLTLRIPLIAQVTQQKQDNGDILLRLGDRDGHTEVVVGPAGGAGAAQFPTLRRNMRQRLDEAEKQGHGTRGDSRTAWVLRHAEVVPILVDGWAAEGQPSTTVRSTAFPVDGRVVMVQRWSVADRQEASRETFRQLVANGIGKAPRYPDWHGVQLPQARAAVPAFDNAEREDLGEIAGLRLTTEHDGPWVTLASVPFDGERDGARLVVEQLEAYLGDALRVGGENALSAEEGEIELADGMIMPTGEPETATVWRASCVTRERHARFRYTATLRPFAHHALLIFGVSDVRDAGCVSEVVDTIAARASAPFRFRRDDGLTPIENGRFPLAFPREEWIAWSHGGGEESAATLLHATGKVRAVHMTLSEAAREAFDASGETRAQLSYLRSGMIMDHKSPGLRVAAQRMLGGALRDWHGFDYTFGETERRCAGGVWLSGEDRLLLTVDHRQDDAAAFAAAFDELAIDGFRGSDGVGELASRPLPYAGMWLSIPVGMGLADRDSLDGGVAAGVTAPSQADWSALVHVFRPSDPEVEDGVLLTRLLRHGLRSDWDQATVRTDTSFVATWHGEPVPAARMRGRLLGGREYRIEARLLRRGDLVHAWVVRGDALALDSLRPVLDRIAESIEIEAGALATRAPNKETTGHDLDAGTWKLPAVYDAQEDQGMWVFFNLDTLGELVYQAVPKNQNRVADALDLLDETLTTNDAKDPAARELVSTALVELGGRLHPATQFDMQGSLGAVVVLSGEKNRHVVLAHLCDDPLDALLTAVHGFPLAKE